MIKLGGSRVVDCVVYYFFLLFDLTSLTDMCDKSLLPLRAVLGELLSFCGCLSLIWAPVLSFSATLTG